MDPFNKKCYKSLGEFLRDYRRTENLTQEKFSDTLETELRTYRRWENDLHPPNRENLIKISRITGMPMKGLILVSFGVIVYYSITKRRIAYSELEKEFHLSIDYINDRGKPDDEGVTLLFKSLTENQQMKDIIAYDKKVFPADKSLELITLRQAVLYVSELNFIAVDEFNMHIGHITCLPLSLHAYEQLKKRQLNESDLQPLHLARIRSANDGVLYFWSTYGASPFIMHNILFKAREYLFNNFQKENIKIACYAFTHEGHEICRTLSMKKVFENKKDPMASKTDRIPTFFETDLAMMKKSLQRN